MTRTYTHIEDDAEAYGRLAGRACRVVAHVPFGPMAMVQFPCGHMALAGVRTIERTTADVRAQIGGRAAPAPSEVRAVYRRHGVAVVNAMRAARAELAACLASAKGR